MNEPSPQIGKPIVEHNLEVGRFIFYANVLVVEFNEGVHVNFENSAFPIQVALQVYGSDKPIVYISHRLHSYSMDPVRYREVVKLFPNFKGFAIVAQNKRRRMLANLERLFIKKPIHVFDNLESAILRADKIVDTD